MFSPRNENDPLDATMSEWFDTPARRQARSRNWALYVARGMFATINNTWVFRNTLSPFTYRILKAAIRDVVYELEQQYPDSPGPKTVSRRSRSL